MEWREERRPLTGATDAQIRLSLYSEAVLTITVWTRRLASGAERTVRTIRTGRRTAVVEVLVSQRGFACMRVVTRVRDGEAGDEIVTMPAALDDEEKAYYLPLAVHASSVLTPQEAGIAVTQWLKGAGLPHGYELAPRA